MISKELVGYLHENFLTEDAKIDENTNLENIGIDSLGVVQVGLWVEEEYGMEIPDDEIDKWETVGDVQRAINGKQL